MRDIVEFLAQKEIICRRFEAVDVKTLESRKRLEIYRGVDIKGYYCMIIVLRKKSRILIKEAKELEELHYRLEQKMQVKIKRIYLLYKAPLCSKALSWLKERTWRIFELES